MKVGLVVREDHLEENYNTCSCPIGKAILEFCLPGTQVTVRQTNLTLERGKRWVTLSQSPVMQLLVDVIDTAVISKDSLALEEIFPTPLVILEIPDFFLFE